LAAKTRKKRKTNSAFCDSCDFLRPYRYFYQSRINECRPPPRARTGEAHRDLAAARRIANQVLPLGTVFQHARTLWDFKAQYNLSRTYRLTFDIYNLTHDWTNNDYIHAFGREIPSYAAGAGTSFKLGVTARL